MDCNSSFDNKTTTADYESRFEASRQKLHEGYERYGKAKQLKRIQVIDIQKEVKEQPRCTAKSKGKPSLRQKLVAMGTRKCSNKFPIFVTVGSCIK